MVKLHTDARPELSSNTGRHNLPMQRAPLIGREAELNAAQGLLLRDDVGLLTLTGAAGTGKTRLALQLAADVLAHFADGAFFVALAPISDPTLIAAAIIQTLGLQDVGGRPPGEILADHLRDRQMLLVLDNFEHVLEARALVTDLLASSPRTSL